MRKRIFISFAIFLFLIPGIWPISDKPSTALGEELSPLKQGEELYQKNCSVCHGDKGDGKTWVSEDLNPRPKDFTDPKVIKDLTRDRMKKSITNGRSGTAMQPFKTQLSESEINLITDYILTAFMKIDNKSKKKK